MCMCMCIIDDECVGVQYSADVLVQLGGQSASPGGRVDVGAPMPQRGSIGAILVLQANLFCIAARTIFCSVIPTALTLIDMMLTAYLHQASGKLSEKKAALQSAEQTTARPAPAARDTVLLRAQEGHVSRNATSHN